jgi:hypothetical protein
MVKAPKKERKNEGMFADFHFTSFREHKMANCEFNMFAHDDEPDMDTVEM